MKSHTRYHGWVFVDAVMAISLLGALMLAVSLGIAAQRRALTHLSDSRTAQRSAESSLITLQSGGTIDRAAITNITEVPQTPGNVWVTVHAEVKGRLFDMTGLVPAESIHGGGQ